MEEREFIMYESPITKYMSDIQSEIQKQEEEQLMITVNQAIGFDVDKNELIKALQYDRAQYEKGYKNALEDVSELIAYYDYRFMQKYYPEECEQGYTLHDLNNKYGLAEILKNWERYKEIESEEDKRSSE